jgi:hypothetical protein
LGGSLFEASLGKKFARPHLNQQMNAMVHTCHPKLCRKLGLRISKFQATPRGKKFVKPLISIEKAGHGGVHLSSQLQQGV